MTKAIVIHRQEAPKFYSGKTSTRVRPNPAKRWSARGGGAGAVKVQIGQTYALKEARQAHMDLEGRKTRGLTVLRV